jgi:hypothetical protein
MTIQFGSVKVRFDGTEEIPRGLSVEVLHEAILLRREDVNRRLSG